MSSSDRIVTIEEEKAAEFGRRLRAEVEDVLTSSHPTEDQLQAAFASVAGGYIEQDGGLSDFISCSINEKVGRHRVKIEGYSAIDDTGTLRLVTAAYSQDAGTVTATEFNNLVRFACNLTQVIEDGRDLDDRPEVLELVRHIRDNHDALREIRVIVVSSQTINADDLEAKSSNLRFISEHYDIDRLYRISDVTIRRSDIQIDFTRMLGHGVPCIEVSGKDYNYKTYLLTLNGETLFQLFERYGSKLYELNLRSYLQPKTGVNRGILETIRSAPVRFLAYNNGICATADVIEAGLEHGQTVIKRLVGLQIVNGAQTTSTIHRARKAGEDLSHVHVAVKLTKVEGAELEEFVPRITEYANTQNPIKAADLQSNIKFHRLIEELAENIWCPDGSSRWFYERTRGAYEAAYVRYGTTPKKKSEFREECPKNQKFGKTDLATYLVAWHGEPNKVCLGAQKNFNHFMDKVVEFVPGGDPGQQFFRDAVSKALVYDEAKRVVRKAGFPAYRAQITAYLVAACAMKLGGSFRLDRIWREQGVSEELSLVLSNWAPLIQKKIVDSANGQNVTEWCKKEGCWAAVKALALPCAELPPEALPEDRDPLFAVPTPPVVPTPERASRTAVSPLQKQTNGHIRLSDIPDVDLCRSLNERAWAKIALWGAETRALDDFERKIVATMQQMSVGGWPRDPSPKQAKHAGRIARRAIEKEVVAAAPV